jgi:hypothetical protein
MQERVIDLNGDLGEGVEVAGQSLDALMMPHVSSANIACGGHAGDAASMEAALRLARQHGVALAAAVRQALERDRVAVRLARTPVSPRIEAYGDAALRVQCGYRATPETMAQVQAWADVVQAAGLAGVTDVVPGYVDVTVCFDRQQTTAEATLVWLWNILSCASTGAKAPVGMKQPGSKSVWVTRLRNGEFF